MLLKKEMALTRKMFLGTLPRALDTQDYTVNGEVVTWQDGPKLFEITFIEKPDFKLGGFAIPRADVTLKLSGYSEDEADVAVKRFERYFHRGGG